MKPDRSTKKRQRLAKTVLRATVPERPVIGRGPRYLVQPYVTAACAPSLHAIAEALADETYPIDEQSLEAVRWFITDGASPFFGHDSGAALQEAARLQFQIAGVATPTFDDERLAVAV